MRDYGGTCICGGGECGEIRQGTHAWYGGVRKNKALRACMAQGNTMKHGKWDKREEFSMYRLDKLEKKLLGSQVEEELMKYILNSPV